MSQHESPIDERDVERVVNASTFATTLRRIADAVEAGESFRIQVHGVRVTVPAGAALSIEHEVEDGQSEIELQLKWGEGEE